MAPWSSSGGLPRGQPFEGETSLVILGHDSPGAVQLQARPRNALKTPIEPGAIRVRPTLIGPTEWIMNRTGILTPRIRQSDAHPSECAGNQHPRDDAPTALAVSASAAGRVRGSACWPGVGLVHVCMVGFVVLTQLYTPLTYLIDLPPWFERPT